MILILWKTHTMKMLVYNASVKIVRTENNLVIDCDVTDVFTVFRAHVVLCSEKHV